MSGLIKIIRDNLKSIIDNIDAGNTNISEEEALEVIDLVKLLADSREKLSVYQVCKFLNVSRATFDKYVSEGKLMKGRKQQGFKELFYYKKDLIDFKERFHS